jgi:hypothetical protein
MRTRTGVLAATAVAVAATVTIAMAAIPSSDGTIYGCYTADVPNRQPLSIVENPSECKDTLLPFNQRGPTGPQGAIGASHRVNAAVTQTTPPDGEFYAGTASCPAGEILLGGGFDADRLAGSFNVITNRPNVEVRGWDVKLKITSPFGGTAQIGDLFESFRRWRDANERAQQELVRAALQRLFDSLSGRGPGGSQVTPKEASRVKKAVDKTVALNKTSKRASTALEGVVKDLTGPKTLPAEAGGNAGSS